MADRTADAALAALAHAAGLGVSTVTQCTALPATGGWHPSCGIIDPASFRPNADRPLILIVFYRAYLAAHDLHPIAALHSALEQRGFDALSIFVPSLKPPEVRAQVDRWVRSLAPAAIVNAVYDATGILFHELPLTPDVVLAALENPPRENPPLKPKAAS